MCSRELWIQGTCAHATMNTSRPWPCTRVNDHRTQMLTWVDLRKGKMALDQDPKNDFHVSCVDAVDPH